MLKVRNKLTVIAKMLNSAPDSIHTGVNYRSISPIRIELKMSMYQIRVFLPVRHVLFSSNSKGAQWLSGRVLDSRPKGRGFQPHQRHCVVVLEQGTFILA